MLLIKLQAFGLTLLALRLELGMDDLALVEQIGQRSQRLNRRDALLDLRQLALTLVAQLVEPVALLPERLVLLRFKRQGSDLRVQFALPLHLRHQGQDALVRLGNLIQALLNVVNVRARRGKRIVEFCILLAQSIAPALLPAQPDKLGLRLAISYAVFCLQTNNLVGI